MTGRRNRAPNAAKFGTLRLPNWFFPPRPRRSFPQGKLLFDAISRQIFLPLAFYMDQKNWLAKSFGFSEQPQNSVRTSFGCCSICLREFFSCGNSRISGSSKTLRRRVDPYGFAKNFLLAGFQIKNIF